MNSHPSLFVGNSANKKILGLIRVTAAELPVRTKGQFVKAVKKKTKSPKMKIYKTPQKNFKTKNVTQFC